MTLPLSGAILVFRRRMRLRCAWRDLVWASVLYGAVGSGAAWLHLHWAKLSFYNSEQTSVWASLFQMSVLTESALFPLMALFLGTTAAPERDEFMETQSALLSRLTAFEICLGRLLASVWIVVVAVLMPLLFWLVAQLLGHVVGENAAGAFGRIVGIHGLVFAACLMTASVALLFAINRRPGRNVLRGAFVSCAVWALGVFGLFLVESQIRRMSKPGWLIEAALAINPVAAAGTAQGMDILRTEWIYDHTSAPEYLFAYPSPFLSGGIFFVAAIVLLMLAAVRLRRAYR